MDDKFSNLFQSINNTLNDTDIIHDKKQIIIQTLLEPQNLTSLKKLCTRKYFNVSGCTSQKIVGSTTEKKNQIKTLIINHLFPSKTSTQFTQISKPKKISKPIKKQPPPKEEVVVEEPKEEAERESISKEVRTLRRELRKKNIRHNIRALTDNKKEKLEELLNNDRCSEDTDFDSCSNNESCHIKNKLCVDSKITKIGQSPLDLERLPIVKEGRTFYVLTTKEEAEKLQARIDSKVTGVDTVLNNINNELEILIKPEGDINFKDLRVAIKNKFPNLKSSFISHAIRKYLVSVDIDIKQKDFDYSQSIYKDTETDIDKSEVDTVSDRFKLFIDEGMIETKGDGNCYFRCISQLLNLSYGVDISHSKCREDIVNMIRILYNNDNSFKTSFESIFYNTTIENYTQKMSTDKEWAGEIEIIATCILYNVNINISTERKDNSGLIIPNLIFNPSNKTYRHLSENIEIDEEKFNNNFIWGLYHVGDTESSGNHYNFNRNVYINKIIFIDSFNPNNLRIDRYKKSEYYEDWLSRFYNNLISIKLESTDYLSSQELKEQIEEPEPESQPEPEPIVKKKKRVFTGHPGVRKPVPIVNKGIEKQIQNLLELPNEDIIEKQDAIENPTIPVKKKSESRITSIMSKFQRAIV